MHRTLAIALCAWLLPGCDKLNQLMRDEVPREAQTSSLLARAEAAVESGQLDTAAMLYEQLSSVSPNDPSVFLALGKVYSRLGNDGQAIFALKRALELDPKEYEARVLLGQHFLRQGRTDMAIGYLKRAAETPEGRGDAELQRKLATALLQAGKADEAERIIEAVDKLTPNDPETLALFAEILLARGQEERAVRLLDLAVAAKGDSARVRTARAKYFNSRGKVNEALQEFDVAVAAAPEDMDLALARARALAAARRYMDASTAMDEIILARPTDINVQAAAAEIKLAAGDPEGALQMAETILARQAKHLRALFVRARAIETAAPEEPVRAIGAYRQVLAVEPGHAESLARLWPLYVKDQAKPDAIATLEHLQLLGEADRAAELELAALYNETGINPAAGLKIVEAALKREPDSARLLKLRKELSAKVPRAPAGGSSRGPPAEGGGRGIEVMRGGRTD